MSNNKLCVTNLSSRLGTKPASDALNLLGYSALPNDEMVEIMALVRGRRPGDETVIRVGSKNVSQRDMSRLDGPVLPKSKRSADLWLNDSIITYMLHILHDNDKSMCQNDKERKPTYFAGSYFYIIIIKQKFYSRLIAIEDSKKGIALMLPKAAGLSISPLVGQNGFPHVTGGSGALAPELRFDTPGPAYAGPDFITVWHQLCYDICREIGCKNRRGKVIRTSEKPAVCCLC